MCGAGRAGGIQPATRAPASAATSRAPHGRLQRIGQIRTVPVATGIGSRLRLLARIATAPSFASPARVWDTNSAHR